MPVFCIYDHPKLPLVMVTVRPKRTDVTKDGFRLRYVLALEPGDEAHADDVIGLIDAAMGPKTKAHGFYQAPYAEVRDAYRRMLEDAALPERLDWSGPLRGAAVVVAIALTVTMAIVLPAVTLLWLAISAFQRHNGLTAMAESAVVWSIFDWRPLIHKLFRYAGEGVWPR